LGSSLLKRGQSQGQRRMIDSLVEATIIEQVEEPEQKDDSADGIECRHGKLLGLVRVMAQA